MTVIRGFAAGAAFIVMIAGAASAQEPGLPGGLARADADGDGRITLDELRTAREQAFGRLDQNGDGQLTGEELRGRMAQGEVARDGVVTQAEFMGQAPPVMARFDANRDNVLDQTELQAVREARPDRGGRPRRGQAVQPRR